MITHDLLLCTVLCAVDLCELVPESGQGFPTRVAVKRMHPHLAGNERELEAFTKEAELLRKLEHPSIVRFIGVGHEATPEEQHLNKTAAEGNSTLIIQEYLDGGSLKLMLLDQVLTGSCSMRMQGKLLHCYYVSCSQITVAQTWTYQQLHRTMTPLVALGADEHP